VQYLTSCTFFAVLELASISLSLSSKEATCNRMRLQVACLVDGADSG